MNFSPSFRRHHFTAIFFTLVMLVGCQHPPTQTASTAPTETELTQLLDAGTFSLISAGRNPSIEQDRALSDAAIAARYEKLKQNLITSHYDFQEVKGNYGGLVEVSYLTKSSAFRECELLALGVKLNQDSIILTKAGVNALVFTTGPNAGNAAIGKGWVKITASDKDRSAITLADKKEFMFALNFDFEHMVPYLPFKQCKGLTQNTPQPQQIRSAM